MNAIDTWKSAGEAGDAAAALTALTEDAELVSPLTARFRFRGADEIGPLLTAAFEVLSDYRYETDLRGDREAHLTARALVRGVELHELQHLELDRDGLIRTITVAMRPLPAITAFAREMGPLLAAEWGAPGAARRLRFAGAFLDSVASTGDRTFIPLAAPPRAR
ncbi:MAG: hypothetical protein QM622_01435 [Microbacterium sp.]